MTECTNLTMFPPIIRMKNLETLMLCECTELRQFPEIQMNMDKLVRLDLEESGIESLPSSIGKYCTNLVSLDMRECRHLRSIESNFHLLKHLKELHLEGCNQLNNVPAEGLFDVECCLQLLSLSRIPFEILPQGMVSMKLIGFPSSLTRLDLSECNLVDGDISSVLCGKLSNLQALDLSRNKFSRVQSLSQLPRLKYLNLSCCLNLVELPDLPSSIAILVAFGCDSLQTVGDFPTNLKWLWKVSLSVSNILGDNCERVLQSMLQGNAIEDYFISLWVHPSCTYNIVVRGSERETYMLELPLNWYNEFSGFLVYANCHLFADIVISMEDVMGRENKDDVLEVSDEEDERSKTGCSICYISFGSLRNTSWWNSTRTSISFSLQKHVYGYLNVELVPRRSQCDDSIERPKDTTYFLEFWDKEVKDTKTFEIVRDSKSSIKIQWFLGGFSNLFNTI